MNYVYKQSKNSMTGKINLNMILRLLDTATIPFDPANTDYQRFKTDIAAGAELQDADGNVMSADDAQAFVATLP